MIVNLVHSEGLYSQLAKQNFVNTVMALNLYELSFILTLTAFNEVVSFVIS